MEMSVFISIAAAILAVLSICAIFVLLGEQKHIIKRLSILENIIEDLNRQNHKLNKKVEDKVAPLARTIEEAKKITSEYREGKNESMKPRTIDYEKSVVTLYREGKNESEIAEILRLEVKQVELILSLNNPE